MPGLLNVIETDLPAIWNAHLGPVLNAIWWVPVPLFVHVIESPALIVSSLGLSEWVPSIEMTGPLAAAAVRARSRGLWAARGRRRGRERDRSLAAAGGGGRRGTGASAAGRGEEQDENRGRAGEQAHLM